MIKWVGLLVALWSVGCGFHVVGTTPPGGDGMVPADGALPDDAAVPGDLAGVDLARSIPDLFRRIPDGAAPGFPGYPCDHATDCVDEYCVDGYCCDTSCNPNNPLNLCRACNIYGQEGHCALQAAGTPPTNGHCPQTASTSCGTDGLCNAFGSCEDWSLGTLCGAPSCEISVLHTPHSCDGAGHCLADSVTASCGGYACAPMSCEPRCRSAADCATGISCKNGLCGGKRALGVGCGGDGDCDTGHCAQGVCCQSSCAGNCSSCAQPLALGLCLPVAGGTDPLGQCAASAQSTCGLDGTCNGQGACRNWAAGIACAPRSCSGDLTVSPGSCDGVGHCSPGLSSTCGNYSCNAATGSCYGSPCSGDGSCAMNHHCTNGTCQ